MALNREPQTVDKETWYYEERKGLLVVHEIRLEDGGYLRTDQFVIPWRMLVESTKQHKQKRRPSHD